ncbi:DNA-binding protein [Albidovulum sp.]|uniref:DNA-binding protein n=1 Tax=Albidovulum sp. TaxID=1872424 RepID=UPI0039B9BDAE
MKDTNLQSLEQVRRQFAAEGVSVNQWAKARGYRPRTVYAVLSGQLMCSRGASHQIAVALGLKSPPKHAFLAE